MKPVSENHQNLTLNDQIQHLLAQGVEAVGHSKFEEASLCFHKILGLDPQSHEALYQLGLMAYRKKEFYLAVGYFQIAQFINPHNVTFLSSLGSAYKELKQYELAKQTYLKALSVQSNFAPLHYNFGNLLNEMKDMEGAAQSYQVAIQLDPRLLQAHVNLGNMLTQLKKFDTARLSYEKALALDSTFGLAYANRGKLSKEELDYGAALEDYDRAIALNPNIAKVYVLKAELLNLSKKFDEAVQHYDQALRIDPHFENVLGLRLHNKMLNCNWHNFDNDLHHLIEQIALHHNATQPAQLLSLMDSGAYQCQASQIYVNQTIPENKSHGPLSHDDYSFNPKRRIKLAYVSADFKTHAVCILMAQLFELHNKQDFELIAFDATPIENSDLDPMRQRVLACFDHCYDIRHLSDKEAAQLARQLKVDIAIDLGGHTYHSRTGLFAYRAAPVQMSYIGYLGTLGAPYMDYLLADKTLIPEKSQNNYVEKIIYLPCYQVNDSQRQIADRIFTREELGLPAKGFVFCCFNNNYKITPRTFVNWIKILHGVPESSLLLLADNPLAKSNMIAYATSKGLNPERLVFGERLEPSEYLARYKTADLFLDTLPYNAGTTASDALWVGLPVLTQAGESFASRMAASTLMGLDLSELVTHSDDEYSDKAIELATHPLKLQAIREKLQAQKKGSLLFNPTLFTKNWESALKKAVNLWALNQSPQHIDV